MEHERHRLINYTDTKAKCRHLKKLTCKGTLRQVFIRVYRLEIHSVMLVFRPSFANCCPSNLLSGSTPPTPTSPFPVWISIHVLYIRIPCVRGRGFGVLLETIFCRTLTLCIWPDSEPTKLLHHPKQKLRRGRGLRQINTCGKVPFQVNFFRWRHFSLVSLYVVN